MVRTSTSEPKSESKQGRRLLATAVRMAIRARSVGRIQKDQSGSGGIQNKGGKGKQKNGAGKGAGSLEQGELAAVVEPQPQPALASSLDVASFETLVRSSHLDPEGWLRCAYDTGAVISAFPLDAKLARKRRRMNVATRLLQVKSFPTVVACACRRRLTMGMECLSKVGRQMSTKL